MNNIVYTAKDRIPKGHEKNHKNPKKLRKGSKFRKGAIAIAIQSTIYP